MRRLTATAMLIMLAGTFVSGVGIMPASAAAVIVVTTTRDIVANDAWTSVREAVTQANRQPGPDSIRLAEGALYRLTRCAAAHEDANISGDLDLTDVELTFDGTGATLEQTCRGERVLHALAAGNQLNLFQVVVDSGNTARNAGDAAWKSFGGGLYTEGSVLLRGSRFESNASPTTGGAVWAAGRVDMLDSLMSGNTVGANGAGIAARGEVSVLRSTLEAGVAGADGGAIWSKANVYVKDSTLHGNTAGRSGGAISGAAPASHVYVDISTLTENSGGRDGGGVSAPSILLAHATVVDNAAPVGANLRTDSLAATRSLVALARGGVDCSFGGGRVMRSSGWNVRGDASCNLRHPADLPAAGNPGLLALADNGGPTPTRLPAPGSVVIDHVAPGKAGCGDPLFPDQRSVARPQGAGCDVGSAEVQ